MTKEELHNLVERYAKLFRKDKNYYSMDYGTRFNPTRDPKTNKIKYKKSPGDNFSPFWFCGHGINGQIYKGHITKTIDVIPVEHFPNEEFYKSQLEERKKSNEVDMGIIMPPTNEKNEASFGAIDHDTYKSPEELSITRSPFFETARPKKCCVFIKDDTDRMSQILDPVFVSKQISLLSWLIKKILSLKIFTLDFNGIP